MKGIRYTDEFKSEAMKQITERGHDVADVAQRLGVSPKSLYKWRHEIELQKRPSVSADVAALKQEIARLNAALKRATEERDILKKAAVDSMGHCNISIVLFYYLKVAYDLCQLKEKFYRYTKRSSVLTN